MSAHATPRFGEKHKLKTLQARASELEDVRQLDGAAVRLHSARSSPSGAWRQPPCCPDVAAPPVVLGALLVERDEERERRRDDGGAGAQHELRALHVDGVALTKATKSSSFFSDSLTVEIHCDAMASALSSKQACDAMALSGTDPPSSARMAGAGKTYLAERPVDHEQLIETPPPPPPRDAIMIARRTSMRIADGGPRRPPKRQSAWRHGRSAAPQLMGR